MQLKLTKCCSAFTLRYRNDNTKLYSKQCKAMQGWVSTLVSVYMHSLVKKNVEMRKTNRVLKPKQLSNILTLQPTKDLLKQSFLVLGFFLCKNFFLPQHFGVLLPLYFFLLLWAPRPKYSERQYITRLWATIYFIE